MSRLAPFVDAAASIDRTAWPNLFISYYTYGSAIAMGLDLSLRDRTDGKLTIDAYMRALWRRFGRASNQTPGLAPAAYTIRDLENTLGEVSGDSAFAKEFFERYVEGREVVDYAKLFLRAGLVVRKRAAGTPWLGDAQLQAGAGGARVASLVPFGSPLYKAGVAQDDLVVSLDGTDARAGHHHRAGPCAAQARSDDPDPLRPPRRRAGGRDHYARRRSAHRDRADGVRGRDAVSRTEAIPRLLARPQ